MDFQQFGAHIVDENRREMAQLLCGKKTPDAEPTNTCPGSGETPADDNPLIKRQYSSHRSSRKGCRCRMPVCQLVYKGEMRRATSPCGYGDRIPGPHRLKPPGGKKLITNTMEIVRLQCIDCI